MAAGCRGPANNPREIHSVTDALGIAAPQVEFDHPFADRRERTLMMDIFFPAAADTPAPAVVLVHGSFWLSGKRSDMADWATDLANQGYLAATIDYRFIQEGGQYPAPVSDVLAAIAHLRSQAAAWNIDPERIALFGVSAGAQLALLAGMAADASVFDPNWPKGESARVRSIVDIYGPTDFTVALGTAEPWQIALVTLLLGGSQAELPDVWREASPITYVRADGPPVFILHGSDDDIVPVTQSQLLSEAMGLAGQTNLFIEIPGAGHYWGSVWTSPWAQDHRADVLEFLRDHFR